MKNHLVLVDSIKEPIRPSPGFRKKLLSDYKLDIMGLCGFGCSYCSSNDGNYLRINREPFAERTGRQLGVRLLPSEDPALTFLWPDVLERMNEQLSRKRPGWGTGETLVFSMLTDAFSPIPLSDGTTEAALRLMLKRTAFRIRVLTKNAAVGSDKWIRFFQAHPGRFVVGLSCGTMDDSWARKVEKGTSPPTKRLSALRRLQDAGVPTYGMLCPVFPDVLGARGLEQLIDEIRPERVEHVWAEPYNDRNNWDEVRAGYPLGSGGYEWMTRAFGDRDGSAWSAYATELYVRLRDKAACDGWLQKLRYLMYELDVTKNDAGSFEGLAGVLLQSKPDESGRSKNPHFAKVQSEQPIAQGFAKQKKAPALVHDLDAAAMGAAAATVAKAADTTRVIGCRAHPSFEISTGTAHAQSLYCARFDGAVVYARQFAASVVYATPWIPGSGWTLNRRGHGWTLDSSNDVILHKTDAMSCTLSTLGAGPSLVGLKQLASQFLPTSAQLVQGKLRLPCCALRCVRSTGPTPQQG